MCYNSILSLSKYSICPRFGWWKPLLVASYVLSTCPYHSLRTSLHSSTSYSGSSVLLLFQLWNHCSPRMPDAFYWKTVFKNQDLGLGVLIAMGVLLLGPFSRARKYMYSHTYTSIVTFIFFIHIN